MSIEQWIVFGTLALTLFLFINGRWRYDVVALMALGVVTVTGIVPAERAFLGFSNPAVITVAAVLVLSKGLQNSGLVELIGQWLAGIKGGITLQLLALTSIVAFLSAFMNNVGALALLLPVAIQLARQKGNSPSLYLMPLAFASLLGGMTTLIGTPPNIIASAFRTQSGAAPFGMFDFTPVGAGIAIAGILFISLIGWRFLPARRSANANEALFNIEEYVTEVRITEKSPLVEKRLYETKATSKAEVTVIGLVRDNERKLSPAAQTKFRANDILMVNADAENIQKLISACQLELVGSQTLRNADLQSEEVTLMEAVIMPNSIMSGGTAFSLDLRKNYDINLIAISRQGLRLNTRLDRTRFRTGDVLLLQSHSETLKESLSTLGCLPLAARALSFKQGRSLLLTLGIFIGALALSVAGLLPIAIAFLLAILAMVVTNLITLRDAYKSIDLPIIILLGAMIPVGEALETSGGAQLIANGLLTISSQLPPVATLAIILVGTMFLSDLVNNAAAVVLMAPIGIGVARGMGVSIDPFLMAITIGASCAFLTPIGHQSNTLVMGPGGYQFGDYWRMGLLLEIIVLVVAIPLILIFWQL
jgi:di/tricarboxylate transporter